MANNSTGNANILLGAKTNDEAKDLVLIVDDDEAVLSTLARVVKSAGLEAHMVSSGEDALRRVKERPYSIILMDVNMHGMDGFETVSAIRALKITTPIIIISGRKEDFDALYGLDIGADDYITKPFNPVTLGAKIKALIRRSRSAENADPVITCGPFTYNTSTLRLFKNDKEIYLSGKENAIMKLFIDNPNRIFTKDLIYDMIWDNAVYDENAIMVYINRLRAKIEDDPANPVHIQTVRGLGYRFVASKQTAK